MTLEDASRRAVPSPADPEPTGPGAGDGRSVQRLVAILEFVADRAGGAAPGVLQIARGTGSRSRSSPGTCARWWTQASSVDIETDSSVQNTPTAKPVDRIVRRLRVDRDHLHYEMFMEAVGVGLTLHLSSDLTRRL